MQLEFLPLELLFTVMNFVGESKNLRASCKTLKSVIDTNFFQVQVKPPKVTEFTDLDMKNLITTLYKTHKTLDVIKGFSFADCQKIEPSVLQYLPTSLEILDISNHRNLDKSTFHNIPTSLRVLNIANNWEHVNDGTMKVIMKRFPMLVSLNITGIHSISLSMTKKLAEFYGPKFKIIKDINQKSSPLSRACYMQHISIPLREEIINSLRTQSVWFLTGITLSPNILVLGPKDEKKVTIKNDTEEDLSYSFMMEPSIGSAKIEILPFKKKLSQGHSREISFRIRNGDEFKNKFWLAMCTISSNSKEIGKLAIAVSIQV